MTILPVADVAENRLAHDIQRGGVFRISDRMQLLDDERGHLDDEPGARPAAAMRQAIVRTPAAVTVADHEL